MKLVQKNIKRVAIGLLSFLVLIILLFLTVNIVAGRGEYKRPVTDGWETGYIFFSVGDSWKSNAVRSITGFKEWELEDSMPSHCGIIIMEKQGPMLVHESTEEGKIIMESPEQFLNNNGAYIVYALPVPFETDTVKLRKDIMTMLEQEIPFDFKFDHHDSSALYCTEFVVKVFEQNGINQFSDLRDLKYIYPNDILNRCKQNK